MNSYVSSTHARIVREDGRWVVEAGPKNEKGKRPKTFINGERVTRAPLADHDVIGLPRGDFIIYRELDAPREPAVFDEEIPALSTASPVLRDQFEQLVTISRQGRAVTILGETGTGKTMLASTIHELSGRRGNFVECQVGNLARTLIESELFGHVSGAFTGAGTSKQGRLEVADGGTLFLDEIAEVPPDVQTKLLQFTEDGTFYRVGDSSRMSSDVRIISATNQDIGARIRDGRFREDLWYRIAVFSVTLPPLRERKEDLLAIADALLERESRGGEKPSVSRRAAERLLDHDWPGNIRELASVIHVARDLAQSVEEIDERHVHIRRTPTAQTPRRASYENPWDVFPKRERGKDSLGRRLLKLLREEMGFRASDIRDFLGMNAPNDRKYRTQTALPTSEDKEKLIRRLEEIRTNFPNRRTKIDIEDVIDRLRTRDT